MEHLLAFLTFRKKVLSLILGLQSVGRLHVVLVQVWVLSWYSDFFPQDKTKLPVTSLATLNFGYVCAWLSVPMLPCNGTVACQIDIRDKS